MMPTESVSLRQASGTRSIVQAKVKATTKRSTKRKEKMTAKIAFPRIKERVWKAKSVNSAKSSSGIKLTKCSKRASFRLLKSLKLATQNRDEPQPLERLQRLLFSSHCHVALSIGRER